MLVLSKFPNQALHYYRQQSAFSILRMFKQKNAGKTLVSSILLGILLTATQCAVKTAAPSLPKDILGVGIGMTRENAEQRLREIGKFVRDEDKAQQVWLLNNNPNFGHVAIGYDRNNQVRYITAIAKPKDGQPLFFKDVGDLTAAKHDVAGPNHRYAWEVAANENNSGYTVIAQGLNPDFLSLYTLSKPSNPQQKDEVEEEDR